jgi:DNA transformation protein
MAISADFERRILERLGDVLSVRGRRMFGGLGVYSGELFFAVADEDTLYFKVDAHTEPDFIREGMESFQPFGPDSKPMGYRRVPPRVLDDTEELLDWARRAVEVARRARRPRARTAKPSAKPASTSAATSSSDKPTTGSNRSSGKRSRRPPK